MNKSTEVILIEKYSEPRYRELRSFVGSRAGRMTVPQIRKAAIAAGYLGLSTYNIRFIGKSLDMSFKLNGSGRKWDGDEGVASRQARLMTEIFAAARV